MGSFSYPGYAPVNGYMTEKIRQQYIQAAIGEKRLPDKAHRIAQIVSLTASNDIKQPIQFWQLYSVIGPQRIVKLVIRFYQRVFADEDWFRSVFERVGNLDHHVNTQSAMWIDVMGGGETYHGGEFRLNFHHSHNAMALMNDRGAKRWVKLMAETLNDPATDLSTDPRVRPAINTFLHYFVGKYADEFAFAYRGDFGEINPPVKRRINFLNMPTDAIEALSKNELKDELMARGIDVSSLQDKAQLVSTALRL
ncbi:MAG: truncated hemoglobin YjbI [Gammaproteobacteria bacterium]|jgi:truncated hemoglobin YjbI